MRQIRKYQKDKGRILHSNKLLYHSLPIGCILALLLLGCSLLNPAGFGNGISNSMNDSLGSIGSMGSSNKAYAAELTSSTNDTSAALIVDDGNIEDVILAESGVNYKSHNIKIKAANVESYTLQISASSNGTSELKLDGGNTTIPGAGGVVGSNMPTNTWGYAWGAENAMEDSMTYYTLPAYGNVGTTISTGLLASDTPTNNTIDTSNKLSFAANFSDNIPSGHYTTSVLLSLAVEPKALVFNGITTMQEMTNAICSAATENDTTQLKDTRDQKTYWVTKLKDGNCWMTQNLAYDIKAEGITGDELAETSLDVAWDSSSAYPPRATQVNSISFAADDATVQSYNPGSYFCSDNSTDGCSLNSSVNGGHDAVGNYYSWNAVTAGTGGTIKTGTASGSICPRNWQLPTVDTSLANKSFNYLFNNLTLAEVTV